MVVELVERWGVDGGGIGRRMDEEGTEMDGGWTDGGKRLGTGQVVVANPSQAS